MPIEPAVNVLVPNRFLFRFELPVRHWVDRIVIDGNPEKWTPRYRLPPLHRLDGQPPVGAAYLAWHEKGLLVAGRVTGKRVPPRGDPIRFRDSDHLRLMTDMRDARDIRRATRFCQQFYFMPTGGGAKGDLPAAGAAHVARARDDAPLPRTGDIQVAGKASRTEWFVEGFIPAAALVGFDPVEHPRIGFFVTIEDRERGKQPLTVGDELNWWCDPSTWVTGVLGD